MAHTDPHSGTRHHGGDHPGAHVPTGDVGHETSDASLGGVWRFLLAMTVVLTVCFGLMWLLQRRFDAREAAHDVQPSPVVPRQGDRLPPLPRLQTLPARDLAAMHQEEDALLHTWAWTDGERAFAQVPIDRAIEIAAERGLPVPPAPPAAPTPAGAGGSEAGGAPAQAATSGSGVRR
jgi:hypothetical protein